MLSCTTHYEKRPKRREERSNIVRSIREEWERILSIYKRRDRKRYKRGMRRRA